MARSSAKITSAADVVIPVPLELLTDTEPAAGRARNPAESAPIQYGKETARRRKKTGTWASDESAMRLYDGQARFLVRTALLRSEGWKEGAEGPTIYGPDDVAKLTEHLAAADQEHLVVISLNRQNRVLAIFEAGKGTEGGVMMNLRHAVKTVMLSGGVGVVIVHNHPGGLAVPSQEDRDTTIELKKAFDCLGVSFQDHVIVALSGFYSFAIETSLLG